MDIIEKLKPLLSNNALPHAICFEGDGRYKATKFFAKAVVCSSENKPCDECNDCKKADLNAHPDIIEYNPTGASKGYPIDIIRSIKSDAFVSPNEAQKKVYILNDVDNISEVSQNALLKILEEPPTYVVFILNCESKAHLLDTIISRVTVFSSGANELNECEVTVEAQETALEIIETAITKNELDLLIKITKLSSDKEFKLSVFEAIEMCLRDMYKIKSGQTTGNENQENLCKQITINNIIKSIDAVETVKSSTFKNANLQLCLTRFCANLKAALGK